MNAKDLQIIAASADTGPSLVDDRVHNMLHMFNHLEYDTDTLSEEFQRDGGASYPRAIFLQTIPPGPRATSGAATDICFSGTGSTKSTRPQPLI